MKKIVVVGNGMVGQKFCEKLVESGKRDEFDIVVFGEEVRPAYDRVHLTSFFSEATVDDLIIEDESWYNENGIELNLGQRVVSIDRDSKTVTTDKGTVESYDELVLSTGSSPFVPPVPGIEKQGVFVYRTIEDLEAITAYAKSSKSAAVIGGGLLGLEAAKACVDLGLKTTVIEMAPRLMPRQLDQKGSDILVKSMNDIGVDVLTGVMTSEISGDDKVTGVTFKDETFESFDMIVVSAGIKPNDGLGRESGLEIGERGGIVVDEKLKTSDKNIYAIGECALYEGMIYGLVAPGFDMADVVATNFCGGEREFNGADMSTKLKLMGMDVASLGNPFIEEDVSVVEIHDTHKGIYKKLVMCGEGKKLLGAILVGDAAEYGILSLFVKGSKELPDDPKTLIVKGAVGSGFSVETMEDDDCVCSCNNVTKGDICTAITEQGLMTLDEVKSATKAGTGCGGCLPMVRSLLVYELEKAGIEVDNSICEHFKYTRVELFDIVRVNNVKSFEQILKSHGTGCGCEVCKTTVASLIASAWNEPILEQDQIQETNDRFLGNIQRNGTYSVIPRSAGGELTPEQLIRMGEVAKEYNLYTKLTGSQRVALFGAHLVDLPAIWEKLEEVGLESGHAYAKGLRMVKSCVGSTWCRYGLDASVDFAIELENRYKGMRTPHKLKGAISGCSRECSEVMSKDFGLIATEHGWNLYVCGNGGTYPRHADLLAMDIDKETAIKYIDRFLMYYIRTADKLQRTSTWLLNYDGGIDKLKEVIIDDSLNICSQLEADMQAIYEKQHDEWAVAVKTPEHKAKFTHFANSAERDSVELIEVRGQSKPAPWEKEYEMPEIDENILGKERIWVDFGPATQVPENGGTALKYGRHQIAVFNFTVTGEWYACQNLCPHKQEMVLARGLTGDMGGIPKVACPMHKKSFSLVDGKSMSDDIYSIRTFKVEVRNGNLFVELPTEDDLDKLHVCKTKGECNCH